MSLYLVFPLCDWRKGQEWQDSRDGRYSQYDEFCCRIARALQVSSFRPNLRFLLSSFCANPISKRMFKKVLTVRFGHCSRASILGILKLMLYSTSSMSGLTGQSCDPSSVYWIGCFSTSWSASFSPFSLSFSSSSFEFWAESLPCSLSFWAM